MGGHRGRKLRPEDAAAFKEAAQRAAAASAQGGGFLETLTLLGDRWTLPVVVELLDGPKRFVDLQEALDGVAPNTLSARLKRLEDAGIVMAVPYQQRPVRHSYELSDRGADLAGPLRLLRAWSHEHGPGAPNADSAPAGDETPSTSGAPMHDACGTPLQVRWVCPTCDVVVTGDHRPPDHEGPDDEVVWL